jgi:hypothetical protein
MASLWLYFVSLILQNCTDILKVELGSCNEACITSCHDGDEVINIKVEEVIDPEEEEDPLLIKFPVTKAEDEVRSVFLSSFLSLMEDSCKSKKKSKAIPVTGLGVL